jgi:hypothetical protein
MPRLGVDHDEKVFVRLRKSIPILVRYGSSFTELITTASTGTSW